mgnify:CR=1 FL=1
MFGDAWNSKSINDLFAHEIEYLIFEPIAEKDPYGNSGLAIAVVYKKQAVRRVELQVGWISSI